MTDPARPEAAAGRLGERGRSWASIERRLRDARSDEAGPAATFDDRWLNDRGLLLDDGALEAAMSAHRLFFTKNNSHRAVLRMENDLVRIALELFHAGPTAAGWITGGGSESLFLAIASALDAWRRGGGSADVPEAVIPATGYPAFEKYARYLGYRVRRVPVDGDFRADPERMAGAIGPGTFMIVASMPSWSHGACDPVPAVASVARAHGIWLHVDACVGGFLAPFARELGREVVDFDFGVEGVSSISADFHKYGYSPKGVSGIFYRDRELASPPFVFDDWAAGLYRSPVISGTRSGGAIAGAWAVMQLLGRAGLRRRAAQILKLRDALVSVVEATPPLRSLGRAELCTVVVGSDALDVGAIAAGLRARGWPARFVKDPPGIQFVLGPVRDEYIARLSSDLAAATALAPEASGDATSLEVVYSDEIPDTRRSLESV